MKIVIIGRSEWLYQSAKLAAERGHQLVLVVTAQEAPEYKNTVEDFKQLAEKEGAEFICTKKISCEIEKIKSCMPVDIALSVNYPTIIPQEVLDLFPHGVLNAHGGDLPRYRGNACQAWAIINCEEQIGLCIHKMAGGELDSGDIIVREYLKMNINTKISEIYQWMTTKIPELFLDAVAKLLENKDYVLEKQSRNPADILRCYPRRREDARINWSKTKEEILRLINASSEPYEGAFCHLNKKKLMIWDADLYEDHEKYLAAPGQVVGLEKESGSVIVITGAGKLKINEISYGNFRGKPTAVIKSLRSRLT